MSKIGNFGKRVLKALTGKADDVLEKQAKEAFEYYTKHGVMPHGATDDLTKKVLQMEQDALKGIAPGAPAAAPAAPSASASAGGFTNGAPTKTGGMYDYWVRGGVSDIAGGTSGMAKDAVSMVGNGLKTGRGALKLGTAGTAAVGTVAVVGKGGTAIYDSVVGTGTSAQAAGGEQSFGSQVGGFFTDVGRKLGLVGDSNQLNGKGAIMFGSIAAGLGLLGGVIFGGGAAAMAVSALVLGAVGAGIGAVSGPSEGAPAAPAAPQALNPSAAAPQMSAPAQVQPEIVVPAGLPARPATPQPGVTPPAQNSR